MAIKSEVPLFRVAVCCRGIVFAVVMLCAAVSARIDFLGHLDKVDFLTEYYFLQDMHAYFGHKNAWQDSVYLVSGYSELEAMMVSYGDVFHIGAMYSNYLGMGKQSAAILFDPREAHYALVPFFEYRHRAIYYQFGLDHRCFHKVDRLPKPISPYWNQLYIKVSSENFRFQRMKNDYLAHDKFGWLDRLGWEVWAGYFLWEFGGMDRSLLSGAHTWGSMAYVDLKYSVYKTSSWLFGARHKMTVYGDTTGTGYWMGEFGIDADVYNRKNTLGFFVKYNYEFPRELPRYSRDRLWAWGVRWRV